MNLFENVKVDKKANVYFEGKVISRNIFCEDAVSYTHLTLPTNREV